MSILGKIFSKKTDLKASEPSKVKVFDIIRPSISSGEVYHFTSDRGVEYEVRIGKITDTLERIINFNVLNDEYHDNEYATTNKGEIFKVVATVLEILAIYIENHPLVKSYEFNGEFKNKDREVETSIRTRFFCRALKRRFPKSKVEIIGNRGIITIR
ncbi:MAG: hypothetical protein A2W91_12050 [Bacteroidetes bacterium GWF2_38_335]|nr:MAG: hypothetical protein A2W91_12050 [Bacteroidetes bacterium GWF2_38_335]OFY76905.1 MAG: hypothetical protein A2281_00165 [Bacteroidetes bacterium RIFOXYA12_FULL_38_20]HBS86754.1 hypothetical protein [Bacteroidales bacterium]